MGHWITAGRSRSNQLQWPCRGNGPDSVALAKTTWATARSWFNFSKVAWATRSNQMARQWGKSISRCLNETKCVKEAINSKQLGAVFRSRSGAVENCLEITSAAVD